MKPIELEEALKRYNGTNNYFKHHSGLLYTDGIRFLWQEAQCYWLLDLIASYKPKLKKNPDISDFQLWILTVDLKKCKGVVNCWFDSPGKGDKPYIRQQIPFTDFPLEEIKIYGFIQEGNQILILPSEY